MNCEDICVVSLRQYCVARPTARRTAAYLSLHSMLVHSVLSNRLDAVSPVVERGCALT